MSLPVRGAWIEIICLMLERILSASRSPCGERGLKSIQGSAHKERERSLPVRGAWIEIKNAAQTGKELMVAPRAGSVD